MERSPAPYGYFIKDEILHVQSEEAEIVKLIFDKFVNTEMGYCGIAKYLNMQGIKKTPRKKSDIEEFSGRLVQVILDNPVYYGKIAYGRRTKEKVKGQKGVFQVVNKQDYSLQDGQHEAVVSEQLWKEAHEKRLESIKRIGQKSTQERSHLLTGLIKCPKCGRGMYANKVCWTKKDGTYKEVYYYACASNKMERGHHCDYRSNLKKSDIEPVGG